MAKTNNIVLWELDQKIVSSLAQERGLSFSAAIRQISGNGKQRRIENCKLSIGAITLNGDRVLFSLGRILNAGIYQSGRKAGGISQESI